MQRKWTAVVMGSAFLAVVAVSAQAPAGGMTPPQAPGIGSGTFALASSSDLAPAPLGSPSPALSVSLSPASASSSSGSRLPVSGRIDAAAARVAIEGANARWLAAFRTGDSKALARIYAPDASLSPPSSTAIEGRDRIVEYFDVQRRTRMGDPSLKTLDVVCVGDVAYETGTYGFRLGVGETALMGDSGRYFAIWKAQPDGSWRYQVGIWSSNRDNLAAR